MRFPVRAAAPLALTAALLTGAGCGGRPLPTGGPGNDGGQRDGGAEVGPDGPNQPPVARLVVPTLVRVGIAASLDGSGSTDPDGTIVAYRFSFGDGTADVAGASATIAHTFGAVATYGVTLTVTDDRGGQGMASLKVTVLPADACKTDSDCGSGHSCVGGTCACPKGTVDCGGTCSDLQANDAHCGSCSKACTKAEGCAAGRCIPADCHQDTDCPAFGQHCVVFKCACPMGQMDCAGNCIDTTTNDTSCGGCGRECAPWDSCKAGLCSLRTSCKDTSQCPSDRTCISGSCTCRAGKTLCKSGCRDLAIDTYDCGACEHLCFDTWLCVAGVCQAPKLCVANSDCGTLQTCVKGSCLCPAPYSICGAECVDLKTSTVHCGDCGDPCKTGESCVAGKCTSAPKCGVPADCPPGRTCTSGLCACTGGLTDCSGKACVDAKTNPDNCGACGVVCPDPHMCVDGRCVHKRGEILETHPLPVPGRFIVGMTSFDPNVFWANLDDGRTVKFDTMFSASGPSFDNPDKTGASKPHGIAQITRFFAMGLAPAASPTGPSPTDDLVLYALPPPGGGGGGGGIGGGGSSGPSVLRLPGVGGACSLGPSNKLLVLQNSPRTLATRDFVDGTPLGSVAVTGFAPGEVVWDIVFDGTAVWAVGVTYAAGGTTAFVKRVNPTTGAVLESVPPPDPSWVSGIAYDGGNIWIAGKTALYRVQP